MWKNIVLFGVAVVGCRVHGARRKRPADFAIPPPHILIPAGGWAHRAAGRTGYVSFWGWPTADRAKIVLSNGRRCAWPRHKRSSLINRAHGALSNRPRTQRASYRAQIISHRTPLRIADRLPPPLYAHLSTKVFLPVFITNEKQTPIGREFQCDT